MATIHISEAEAARDFAGLLSRLRSGVEIVIDTAPHAVRLSIVPEPGGRLLSESIALASAHARATGEEPYMDEAYAADMEEILRNRRPRDTSAWD